MPQAESDPQSSGLQARDILHEDMGGLDMTPPTNSSGMPDDTESVPAAALDMQRRCRLLLDELEQFQAYLKKQSKENDVELRTFKSDVQSEMKFIDKVHCKHPKHCNNC